MIQIPSLAVLINPPRNSLTQILGVSADTTPTITSPVDALAGIPTPPPGVAQEIMTGIPQSAFANVMNPAARQSVLSDWSAGHPPAWYTSLSPDAKSYLSEVQAVGYQLVSGTRRVATATSKKAAAQSLKVPGIVGFGVTVFALLFFL